MTKDFGPDDSGYQNRDGGLLEVLQYFVKKWQSRFLSIEAKNPGHGHGDDACHVGECPS